MKTQIFFLILMLLNFLPITSKAESLVLSRAKVEGFLLTGSGSTYSALVSWQPRYILSENFILGTNFGYAPIKLRTDSIDSLFEWTAVGEYKIKNNYGVELFAGVQHWASSSDEISLTLGSLLTWYPGDLPYKMDSLSLGYSYIEQSNDFHMIRIGIGFKL